MTSAASPLSDEHVSSVVRAISDSVGQPSSLILVGSFAFGFETPTSDIDLLAVVDHQLSDGDQTYRSYALGDLRVDVECVTTRGYLERTVKILDLDDVSFNQLPPRQIELCHRALSGRKLFGVEVESYLIEPGSQDRLAQRLAHRNAAYMPEAFSDLRGAHLTGDLHSMCYLIRYLAELSVDAMLNLRGTCISKPKWRQRLLSEASTHGDLGPEVNDLLFPALCSSKAEAEALARKVMLLSRLAQSRLYECVKQVDEDSTSEMTKRRLRSATWAWCFPLPGTGMFMLEAQGKRYQVSTDVAMAFYALSCRDMQRPGLSPATERAEPPAGRGLHIEDLARVGALEPDIEAA